MKEIYKKCLQSGVDVNYRDVSLANLANYQHSQVRHREIYQVHSDRLNFSRLYTILDEAVDKFVELKNDRQRNKRMR